MFHKHKYGKVEGGYQYCIKCGEAIIAPCKHDWKRIADIPYEIESDRFFQTAKISGTMIVYECQKCKAIRKEKLRASGN